MLGPPQRLPHTGAGLGGGAGERGGCMCAETEAVSSSFEATRYRSLSQGQPPHTPAFLRPCIRASAPGSLCPQLRAPKPAVFSTPCPRTVESFRAELGQAPLSAFTEGLP